MAVANELLSYLYIFIVYFSWWVIPILGIVIAKVRWSRWPIEAIIVERRGDNLILTNDRIGKREDPASGHTTYRLLKMKDVIDVLPFDTILHKAHKNTNLLETIVSKLRPTIGCVHLLKYGSKQYKPIKISASDKGLLAQDENGNFIPVKEMLDSNGNAIYHENLIPFDIRNYLGVIDFQVIDWDDVNTTLNEIENSRLRRIAKWDSWAKFLLPVAIIGVAGVIAIIVIYLTYDAQLEFCKAPQVVQQTPETHLSAENQTLQIIGVTNNP